jgi:predicted Zn-ribbon and HTH transcriptional regulator
MMTGMNAGIVPQVKPQPCSKCKGKGFVIDDILAGSTKKCPQCTPEPVVVEEQKSPPVDPTAFIALVGNGYTGLIIDPAQPCRHCGNLSFRTYKAGRQECNKCDRVK